MRAMKSFIEEGDKVKVTLRFRGREMAHQEIGIRVLERIKNEMDPTSKVEQMPRMENRQMVTALMLKESCRRRVTRLHWGEILNGMPLTRIMADDLESSFTPTARFACAACSTAKLARADASGRWTARWMLMTRRAACARSPRHSAANAGRFLINSHRLRCGRRRSRRFGRAPAVRRDRRGDADGGRRGAAVR